MKILLLSNNPISRTNSNGKTIGNLLSNFSKEEICNFFITDDNKDETHCTSFFAFSTKDVIKSFFTFKKIGNICQNQCESPSNVHLNNVNRGTFKKTAFKMLIRNMMYRRAVKQKSFTAWLAEQKIDIVILQAGDLPFFYDLAVLISKKCNVPFMIYSTEEYPFKEYDYFKRKLHAGLFYNMFHNKLRKSAARAYYHSTKSLFLTDDLKQLYIERFSLKNAETIYNSYDVNLSSNDQVSSNDENLVITYCGNLDNKRWKGIVEIAAVINSIDRKFIIDVYGKCFDEDGIYELRNNIAIRYHGFVAYDEYIKITKSTDIILYTESNDFYSSIDLKYAFSTKIPDSLFTGKPFVCYLPKGLSSSKYLLENKCAYVSDNIEELGKQFRQIINSKHENKEMNIYKNNAILVSSLNHDPSKNSAKIEQLIRSITTKS
ncbi:MAG: hypothetical protein VB015_02480 [Erysipelotrichaceae bacterium]|nr:hypothetical protein [Erysipelotrichaceae bacterium]